MNDMRHLVTAKEVMEELGISRSTLFRYVREKGFPEYKLNRTTTRYDMQEVRAWVRERLISTVPKPDSEYKPSKVAYKPKK